MTPSPDAVPFRSPIMSIEPHWIDFNGHLNMAYYHVLFDRVVDQMWLTMGLGAAYRQERGKSTFTAECHVRYLRELHPDDKVEVAMWLIGADDKRLHSFAELRHATEGWIAATSETMTLHVDMETRKVAPFPPDIASHVAAMAAAHAAIARPPAAGRAIAMPVSSTAFVAEHN
ncbi:MAG: thioesterase family protein [Alphaproteobacteria bacterium]|nr:thioesterase family protein [Alphaproteobacteria bacterium]